LAARPAPIDGVAISCEAYRRLMACGLRATLGETSVRVSDLLKPENVIADLRVADKSRALQELARRAAELADIPETVVHDALVARERLGSTGIGAGIAMPHARIAGLDGVRGLFARLSRPIDFEAVDGRPVDLVFLLLAPEGAGSAHLAALACASRALRNPATAKKLRETIDAAALYAILAEPGDG
jgi:nitrogen PTS system EIIA component